jgi:hypothetical protein
MVGGVACSVLRCIRSDAVATELLNSLPIPDRIKGADPDDVAATILHSVAAGKSDFVVAATFSAKAALWLKFLAPSFLERMLVKRFKKQEVLEN